MELISLTTGSWFPRTKLHLKEYYAFLREGTSHLSLDEDRLKEMFKALAPRNVQYIGGAFDRVIADFDDIRTSYFEDGLLLLTMEVTDFDEALNRLQQFYEAGITQALTTLYSVGTPVVSYQIPHIGERPLVIVTKGTTDDEARIFCAEHDQDIHFIARHTDRTVYFSKRIIIINDETGGPGTTQLLIDHFILFREYEHKLRHYLDLHRGLWEDIPKIQQQGSIPSSELPFIRDQLLNHRRDLAVIRARIGQMETYITERKKVIDSLGLEEDFRAVEAYRFGKIEASTAYIRKLWEMLDEYLGATVELTGFIYQENLEKEISIQQFIFLVAAVAGVLALGDMTGASLWLNVQGMRIEGALEAFHLRNLAIFGGASLAISLLVYFGVRPLIKALSRIKAEKLMGKFEGDRSARRKNHDSNL